MFIPKRLELDVAQQQGDHTHGQTQAAIPPVVSNLDVSKVLYSKSLRDKGNDNSVFHQVIMVLCSLGQKLTQPMLTLRSHTHQ